MAIKIFEKFAPRANPADSDYPYGSIKNESVPGAKDGTPLDAVWGNDYAGSDAALFAAAGITPSGAADTVNASQRVDAMRKIFSNVGTVADIAAGKFKVGSIVYVIDRAGGIFEIVSGGSPDGKGVLPAGLGLTASLKDYGAVDPRWLGALDGADNSGVYQYAIDNYTVTDCGYALTKLGTTVTVKSGKSLLNVNVKNSDIVDNILLTESDTTITGLIDGSGLAVASASQLERGLYGVDASNVKLDLKISNVSVGVQSQTSVVSTGGAKAYAWNGRLEVKDIVGDGSSGGGYGLLLVNTDDCDLEVFARDTPRHALYISAGSSNNNISLHAYGVLKSNALNIRAEPTQNPCAGNDIKVFAKNLDASLGQVNAAYIGTNSHRNTVHVVCDDADGLDGFVKVEGTGGAGQNDLNTPNDNVISFRCKGQTTNSSVYLLNQRGTTILDGSSIDGGSSDAAQAAIRVQDNSGNPAYSGLAASIGRVTLKGNSNKIAIRNGAKGYVRATMPRISGYTSQIIDDSSTFEGVMDKQSGKSFSGVLTASAQVLSAITFPREFALAPRVLVSIVNNSVDANQGIAWVTDVTKSGCNLYIRNTASTDSSYVVQWVAEY